VEVIVLPLSKELSQYLNAAKDMSHHTRIPVKEAILWFTKRTANGITGWARGSEALPFSLKA